MNSNIFGLPVKYEEWSNKSFLPLYLIEKYKFYEAFIDDNRCIIVKPESGESDSVPSVKKHIDRIKKIENVPVVLYFDSLSHSKRQSLMENKISFITDKQAYLPFVGAILTGRDEIKEKTEKFTISAQMLFLLYIYGENKRLYVSEAVKKLPYSNMTLSRAVRQLEASELFDVSKDGVNKIIESKYSRRELFEKAEKFLSSPVIKSGYAEKLKLNAGFYPAGETALSKKTLLNDGNIVTYATDAKKTDKSILSDELINPETQIRLELWAYEPTFFSNDNTADSLSVVLSFSASGDERIQTACEELISKELMRQW